MKVFFVGAGPGDPDLLTVKAQRLLSDCRICIYAGSLVSPEIVSLISPEAEKYNSAGMSLPEIVAVFRDAQARSIDVVRPKDDCPVQIFPSIIDEEEFADDLAAAIRITGIQHIRNDQGNRFICRDHRWRLVDFGT